MARSGSPIRRSACSATMKATWRSPSCRPMCTAGTRRRGRSRSRPAASTAPACSWRRAPRCTRSTSTRKAWRVVRLVLASVLAVGVAFGADGPPEWAYPKNPPGFKPRPDDGTPRRIEGSSASYTLTQLRDPVISPGWQPREHPPQPEVVARGRKPDVFACGFCHRADGPGGPENANLAGMSAEYIKQQMADYKSGARKTSVPGRNVDLMISLAKAASDAEVQAAAAYFSALRTRHVVRVVEGDSVPRTYITGWHFAVMGKGEQEALGSRIIEVPEVLEQFENRDTHARFIAYVPPSSVEKGRSLAATGGGKTGQGATCHW